MPRLPLLSGQQGRRGPPGRSGRAGGAQPGGRGGRQAHRLGAAVSRGAERSWQAKGAASSSCSAFASRTRFLKSVSSVSCARALCKENGSPGRVASAFWGVDNPDAIRTNSGSKRTKTGSVGQIPGGIHSCGGWRRVFCRWGAALTNARPMQHNRTPYVDVRLTLNLSE